MIRERQHFVKEKTEKTRGTFMESATFFRVLHRKASDTTAGSRVLGACNHLAITISELQAQLKGDHAGCAITAQTNAE
jgi:hypothetical protein